MSNAIKAIRFKPAGEKIELVSKREIWESIKEDGFLRELAIKCKPVAIQHNKDGVSKLWQK